MPYRKTPFASGQIYHVFNRSIARQPIFTTKYDYQRAMNLVKFYYYFRPPLRYSHYIRLPFKKKNDFWLNLEATGKRHIEILAFCLMPNHYHFQIRELAENGISTFMKNFQNSYSKYFNTKHDRTGSLMQSMFKAVIMETEEQLLHVNRYIHLNPFTSYVVKDTSDLENYLWSSFPIYLGKTANSFLNTNIILDMFYSLETFKQFSYDQANYQRELYKIKHLIIE